MNWEPGHHQQAVSTYCPPYTAPGFLSKAPVQGKESTSAETTNSTGHSNLPGARRALHQPGRVELRTHIIYPSPVSILIGILSRALQTLLSLAARRSPLAARSFGLIPWPEHDGTARETELSCRSPRAAAPASPPLAPSATMNNLNLPIRSSPTSERNQQSRNYFTSYALPSSTEAINGPVREPLRDFAPIADRLIVGVDFGTTFSG